MTDFSVFVRRVKINHKSLSSYAFILEDSTVTNIDIAENKYAGTMNCRERRFFYIMYFSYQERRWNTAERMGRNIAVRNGAEFKNKLMGVMSYF
jgi:hypothetical protein